MLPALEVFFCPKFNINGCQEVQEVVNMAVIDQEKIEQASRISWPALEEEVLAFGVLRYAQGYTKRANSMTVFVERDLDPVEIKRCSEAFFGQRNLPCVVRIAEPVHSEHRSKIMALDTFLQASNYRLVDKSLLMSINLANRDFDEPLPESASISDWLDGFDNISESCTGQRPLRETLLRKIKSPQFYSSLKNETGETICGGFSVLHEGVAGIYNLATNVNFRGRGLATRVMQQLLTWAKQNAASHAYLQVEQDNTAAVELYKKLGFSCSYQYWYRVKNL